MKFDYVGLKEHCSKIGSGSTPRGGETVYVREGVSFVRSQNVYNLDFHTDGLAHITDEVAKKMKSVSVLENDILLNITGDSVARTCLVPQSVLPARVNQHVAIIRPKESDFDSHFLSYYMASPFMQARMLGLAIGKGASRNAITKEMIEGFEVPYPPLPIQRRIADILSAYDDLIENNRKQIKLLEEAAQRLYKEWFVDLRFPGHEKVKVTDGVPEGWEKGKVEQLACFSRGQMITSDDVIPGDVPVVAGGLQPSCYHNKANTTSPVVTVSASGANAGYIRLYFVDVFASDCSFIDGRSCSCVYFVYCFFRNDVRILRNLQHGSAQPHVYASQINDIVLTIPNRKLIKTFENIVKSYFEEIAFKEKQIKLLQEARDRLLPKLMNGEIEV